ncbi:MAG: CRTAC1 family protein [Phycisphaerales bacterium]
MSQTPQRDEHPDESEPQGDDTLVARGFWRSFGVIVFIAAAIVVFRMFRSAPEVVVESSEPVAAPAQAPQADRRAEPVSFHDITAECGVDFVHESGARGEKLLPECLGSGVAIADLDGDGRLDLVFTQGQPLEPAADDPAAGRGGVRIYMNRAPSGAPRFERLAGDETIAAGCYANGVAVGDVDGDGLPDLFLSAVGQDRLLLGTRDASGTIGFREGSVPEESEWGTSAGMADLDGDGDLDIVVANYVRWTPAIDREVNFTLDGTNRAYGPPTGFAGARIAVLENERGSFRDITVESGAEVRNPATGELFAKSLGLAFVDADRDGRPDILIANDKTPKFMLRNLGRDTEGRLRFADVAIDTGFAYDRDGNATGAMGIDVSWPFNDERLAVAVGNFANEPSSLYIGRLREGKVALPAYTDESLGLGFGGPTRRYLTFGTLFLDADLDGDEDLVQVNGHLEPDISRFQSSQTYRQRLQLFMNTGAERGPRFTEVAADESGALATPLVGRALAAGDLDGDGDLDLVATDLGGAARVFRNDRQGSNHWIALGSRDARMIGAELTVTARIGGVETTQRRVLSPTRSYLSQCEPYARVGLGDAVVAQVRVRLPDGTEHTVGELAADKVHDIVLPSGT